MLSFTQKHFSLHQTGNDLLICIKTAIEINYTKLDEVF